MKPTIFEGIRAYHLMADCNYRPGAPSDGFGNITVDLDHLDIDSEALTYSVKFYEEESTCSFFIGYSQFEYRVPFILAIEAARVMCVGNAVATTSHIRKLLEAALNQLDEDQESAIKDTTWHSDQAHQNPTNPHAADAHQDGGDASHAA